MNLDDLPKRESMSKKVVSGWTDYRHRPRDVPAKAWLQSHVGQKWDDIFSKYKDFVYKHTSNHYTRQFLLYGFVQKGTMIDGKFYDSKGEQFSKVWCEEFIVDQNGILHHLKTRTKWRRKQPVYFWKDKGRKTQYKEIDGLWYICQLKSIDQDYTEIGWYDRKGQHCTRKALRQHYEDKVCGFSSRYDLKHFWGGEFVCVEKKQCNKKELKEFHQKFGK